MSASGSIALWCTAQAAADSVSSLEAHFNYWRLAGDTDFKPKAGTKACDFLEVGILLAEPSLSQQLDIYIPQVITLEVIEDCGARFRDTTIAQGIFNEVLSCKETGPPGPHYIDLDTGASLFCRVHRFLHSNGKIDASELSVRQIDGGTLLTISNAAITSARTNLPASGRLYFRLRIYLDGSKSSAFVRVITPKDSLLQSGYDEVEYIDFRFNEARTLPLKIEGMMRQVTTKSLISKVAFLTAVPVRATLAATNSEWHKSRLLEHQIWDAYVQSGIPSGMMVYHWKKESVAGVVDFSSFVKLQTRKTSIGTMWTYLGIAFGFGVLGNLVANWLQNLFNWVGTKL